MVRGSYTQCVLMRDGYALEDAAGVLLGEGQHVAHACAYELGITHGLNPWASAHCERARGVELCSIKLHHDHPSSSHDRVHVVV